MNKPSYKYVTVITNTCTKVTASDALTLGLSAPMFSPIHSTYECILCNDPEFLIFIDLKILHVHIIVMGYLVFPLTLTPET